MASTQPRRVFTPLDPEAAARMDIGVFGQQAGMQIYTQITYVFEAAKGERDTVIAMLEVGLTRLVAAFPWLGGQIVSTDGRRHFAPLPNGPPPLVVKDASLSIDKLRSAGYPFRLLDESVVAPRRTLPSPDEPDEKPVLLVQATFIDGGVLLTVVAHHAAMDMAGQAAVIRWLAKACRKEAFSEEDLAIGNCDRLGFIDLLGDDEGGQDPFALISEQVIPPAPASTTTSTTPPPTAWSYFAFDKEALTSLKKEATATLPTTGHASFVSTNDALTAFLWQCVVRARRERLEAASSPSSPPPLSTLARAIDIRRFFGLPADAPALLQNMTIHTEPIAHVADAPLGELAAQLRTAILGEDRLCERTRALATAFISFPDKALSSVSFVGSVDTAGGGLMLSSWTLAPGFREDFGFGRPVAVRRPQFTPVESLAYLMPADADGTVAAGICLREADRAWLEDDRLFSQYGRYVG